MSGKLVNFSYTREYLHQFFIYKFKYNTIGLVVRNSERYCTTLIYVWNCHNKLQ